MTDKKIQLTSTIIGAIVNAILAGTKLYIALMSYSISILSDAINNLLDMLGFIVASIAISFINDKPTKNHPYGFGRLEYIITLFISFIIFIIGGVFLFEALDRLFTGFIPISFNWLHFGVLLGSVFVKLALALFFFFMNKKTSSSILKVETLDCFLDSGITGMTVITFLITHYISVPIDGIVGITIAIVILIMGGRKIIKSVNLLIGEKNEEIEEKLEKIVKNNSKGYKKAEIKIFNYGKEKSYAAIRVFAISVDIKKIIEESKQLGIDSTVELRGEL